MVSMLNIPQFASPDSRHHLIATRDLDKAYEFISTNVVPYRYQCLDRGWKNKHAALVHNFADLNDLDVIYINYGRNVLIDADPLDDYLLQIAHSGHCRVSCESREVQLDGKQCSLISPGSPYRLLWTDDCSIFELKIRKSLINRVFESMTGKAIDTTLRFDIGLSRDPRLVNYISSSLSCICAMIEEENMTQHHRHSIKSLGLSILTMILEHQPNSYTPILLKDKAASPRHVKKALEFMQAHYAEPLTLTNIADAANTSVRNLTLSFKKAYNCGPMEYLKGIRLDCARKILKHSSPLEVQVTPVAQNCGFTHMGRFSNDYVKRFGELPSESLKSIYSI